MSNLPPATPEPISNNNPVWRMEASTADCYPLPSYEDNMPLPLFTLAEDAPASADMAHRVPDDQYYLWLTEFAHLQDIDELLQSKRLSDLNRLHLMLEKAHNRLHYMIEQAGQYPHTIVVGGYLSLVLMHAGLKTLMSQVQDRAKKLNRGKQ